MNPEVVGMCSFCGYLAYCVEVKLARQTALICRECLQKAVLEPAAVFDIKPRPPERAAAAGQGELFALPQKREAAG